MKQLILLLFLTAGFITWSQVPNYVPSNGLVGWWPFNGNANDESGNGNDGTNNGATLTTDRFGNADAAYDFDGVNDYISLAEASEITFYHTDDFTISFWIKQTAPCNSYGNCGQVILSSKLGGANGLNVGTSPDISLNYNLSVEVEGDINGVNPRVRSSDFNNTEWFFFTYKYSFASGKQYLYQNCILIDSVEIPSNLTGILTYSQFWIGRRTNYTPLNTYLFGQFDDLGIWDRSLSDSEIFSLYSQNLFTSPVLAIQDTLSACGASTTLDAGTDPSWASYLWNTTEDTQTISVSNSGLYTLEVTDTNGCIGYDTTLVSIINPNITASAETICIGDSAELVANLQDPCNTPEGSLSNGLLGWWPFCGNANDETGNGNNGIVAGALLTEDRLGYPNAAYDFDGIDDEIIVNEVSQLDGTTELTLSCWINLDDVTTTGGGGSGFVPIISKWGVSGLWPESSYLLGLEDDKIVYNIDASQNTPNYPYTVQTPNNLIVQEWYHLVAQNDLNQVKIYVNGQIVAVIDEPNEGNNDNNTELRFASWWADVNSSYSNLDGRIDDVGLWDRILTVSEIRSLYNMGQTNVVWSTSDTTSSVWVTPGATSTYSVTVDDGIGFCTDDIEITVNNPQIDFGAGENICVGDSVLLNAGAGFDQYVWSTGDSTQTIYATSPGIYTATVGLETPIVNEHSLEFDGVDDYLEFDNSNTNQFPISVSLQFKLNDANDTYNSLFASDENELYSGIWLAASNNSVEISYGDGNGTGPSFRRSKIANTNLNIGQWYFVTAIIESQNDMTIYLNGTDIGGSYSGIGGPYVDLGYPMMSGILIDENGDSFFDNFKLGDLQLWNTALTQSEIQNYMNCPPTGNEAGLVGYWNFEEGSGTTAIDQTSNGNDGTINGATYSTDTPEQVCLGCTASADAVVIEAVPTSSTDAHQECESFTWIDGNTYTEDNSTATFISINVAGCDSTITLNLNILESSSSTDTQEACESFTWIDGNTYTDDNTTATFVTTNAAGCDSTITLNLTILESSSSTDAHEECSSFTWIDGNTYTEDNSTATFISINAAGCDSTITLNLNILESSSSTDTQEACASFTWIDGNTYTEDNSTATFITTNAAGCDSTITLNLTILESSSSADIHEACESFTWIDGNTYTESNNTATFLTTNTAGCDSIISLNLTINNLTTLYAGIDQTVCEGTDVTLTATGAAVYEWDNGIQNGVPFPALLGSNTYSVEGTDANGCEDEQSVTITGTAYPELSFEVTDPTCQGESSGNALVVATNGTSPYTFVWNNGALQAENNSIPAGTYEVTVTDNIGCEAQGVVVVIDPSEPCFNIPGGLSPNGDGINDTWTIGGLENYPDAKVNVFDRWGQAVYTGNATSDAWDGTINGNECPTADYYYILELGDGQKFNGVVTLKR